MSLTGTLVHRFGSRRVCEVSAILVLVVIPFLLRAPSQAWLAFTLVLLGATNGTLDIAMNDHAVAIQSRADRPILSSVHGWWCVGGFLGGAATALANKVGMVPRDHLFAASVALAVVLALAARPPAVRSRRCGEGG